MKAGKSNMENKLRQLESQLLPDLTRQDEHWLQMKLLLQPGEVFVKPGRKKIWPWVLAACITGIIILLATRLLMMQNDKPPAKIETALITPESGTKDTIQQPAPVVIVLQPATNKTPLIIFPKARISKSAVHDTAIVSDSIKPAEDTPRIITDVPGLTLTGFFKQLEKPAQEFIINNKKDTVLWGNEGTALLIPANTFDAKEEVTISLKEYYTYEDIITNKLSTMSDGRQLLTGGMIHLTASVNGNPVNPRPSRSIRWFIPDTAAAMREMQIFTGQQNTVQAPSYRSASIKMESNTPGYEERFDNINWVAQKSVFKRNYLTTRVRVLDLRDEPYVSKETKKGKIGKFHLAANSKISKEELEKELLGKYNYYKVKIKQSNDKERFFRRIAPGIFRKKNAPLRSMETLGDSAWMDPVTARRFRLTATDTVISGNSGASAIQFYVSNANFSSNPEITISSDTAGSAGNNLALAFTSRNLSSLAQRYSADISTLGWINCDRFYNDSRPKVPFYVDLKDTASKYYTLLVFDNIKSMMTGSVSGNKVMFSNIPEGETARVLSIGVKNGRAVAAMEAVQISRTTISGLKFEETTPEEFREQAAALDK